MALDRHPRTYYPNTVAGALVGRLDASEVPVEADFYESDIIHDGDAFRGTQKIFDTEIALVHVVAVENVGRVDRGVLEQEVTCNVRVANHYAGDATTQQQECIVLAEQVRERLYGHEIPLSTGGVAGGRRLVETGPVEQEINVANFSVYGFESYVTLYHDHSK